MRFYNYINEMDSQNEKKLIEHLKKCKPFINDWKKLNTENFLYSGRGMIMDYVIKPVRKDRDPLDTPNDIHKVVDDTFNEKFGIKARSNTIFCTSIYSFALKYGEPYYIFPVGKYEIIWSPFVTDLYSAITRVHYDKEKIKTLIKTNYRKGDLKGALQKGNEIMLHCKEYLAVRFSSIEWNKFLSLLKDI